MRKTLLPGLIAGVLLVSSVGHSQPSFPNRPIQLVVTFPAGGSADFVARLLAERISRTLKQQVVIVNRGGAAGSLGTRVVATSQPDGYTLVLTSVGALTINPAISRIKPYNTLQDFAPISRVAKIYEVTMASKESGLQSLIQLVAAAKASSHKLRYGSTGTGSISHLAGELMKQVTGIDLVHIPYTGGATAMSDLLGGRGELLIADIPAYLPHIESGAVVALSINSTERTSAAPNIPTAIEQGFPDIVADNWFGLLAPAGTPEPVITVLNQAVVAALSEPSLKEDYARAGALPVPQSPAEFRSYIAAEEARWGEVIKRAKIQPE
jgi:tripartite-type tricarboxylate transporter receptor subunit TctC